jgi:hypothetical protein
MAVTMWIGTPRAFADLPQDAPNAVRVTAERGYVRQGPSANSAVIATVERGEVLPLVGNLPVGSVLGSWYRVRLQPSNREGFISTTVVEIVRTATRPGQARSGADPEPGQAPRQARPPAQQVRRPPARPNTPLPWGIRVALGADTHFAAAKKTFGAIVGKSTFVGPTVGADVYGGSLPRGLFVRAGFSRFSADGERVFVVDDESFGTGIPLTVKMTPVEIGAGFRSAGGGQSTGRPRSRVTSYVGASVAFVTYQEISEFADEGENDAERFTGFALFAGFDVRVAKFVSAGVEAHLRQIPGFGKAGVSEAFGEDQLGGASVKFLIGFGR